MKRLCACSVLQLKYSCTNFLCVILCTPMAVLLNQLLLGIMVHAQCRAERSAAIKLNIPTSCPSVLLSPDLGLAHK